MSIEKLIIIGSGPAGLTAAIYTARANLSPLVIDGKTPGGQLMGTSFVENWPGNISIRGPELMTNMREHATHFGTRFLDDEIAQVDFSKSPFTLITRKGAELKAQSVLLAMGAIPKKLNCPGEDTYWGKGVTTCAVCDGAFYQDKEVIIVGGGDTAMEEASFMTKFTNKITIIHILDKLTASHAMQQRILNNPAVKIIYNSTVTAIKGDGQHVTGATITNQKTKESTDLPANGIFIAIGLIPKTEIVKGSIELTTYGYVVLKKDLHTQTATSVPGIFAAGDIADAVYRQAITSAGTGCMAAFDVERYLKIL